MAVTAKLFGDVVRAAFTEEHSLLADSIKVMLVTSAFSPDQDTHDFKNDVTNEVVGTGYTATGVALANDTLAYTAGTNVTKYDADDTTWTTSTITARTAIIYNATGGGSDATRGLIGYQQESGDITSTGGTFQITWNASGIATFTVS